MKKIDIIVPIFNEEKSILELSENIRNISNELKTDKQIEPRLSLIIILNVFVLLILGILSSFLGVVIDEVKKKPLYIKEVTTNRE